LQASSAFSHSPLIFKYFTGVKNENCTQNAGGIKRHGD